VRLEGGYVKFRTAGQEVKINSLKPELTIKHNESRHHVLPCERKWKPI
jgi:hypothetical protein